MPQLRVVISLLLLAACGKAAPRASRDSTQPVRASRAAEPVADTAVFVARQAGVPAPTTSAVMQLRIDARDAQVTVENEAGAQALAGAPGGDNLQEIPGSRAATSSDAADAARWHASVTTPVLEGERLLVELYPSRTTPDSATIELTADGQRLAVATVPVLASGGAPALFEVAMGARSLVVGERIERVEIVPTCGTTHLVRNGGLADLYARFEVTGTGESGDVHLPPRDADAAFRSVSFTTRTRGTVRITYLGHELASAPRPEGCPLVP